MYNWGSKFFFGGHTPKPEVEMVGEQREIGRAWGEVSDSEKILENSQGLPRYMGSKKKLWRHLAAKREPLGGRRKGEFVGGIEAYNV